MSVETWARKVTAAVLIVPGERAPVDAVMVDFLDELEDLMRSTRLKIPAFARALTAAGLTLASGEPYDAATLRTQINRARAKRQSLRNAVEIRSDAGSFASMSVHPDAHLRPPKKIPIDAPQPAANNGDGMILMRLSQSKPKRFRPLDADED